MTAPPPGPSTNITASRAPWAGGGCYDPAERQIAAAIQSRHPYWLVCWGTHSRRYWAYPRFPVPPGTLLSAPDSAALVAGMRQAEARAAARPPAGWAGGQR